jgi:alpha-mannosidase
VSGIDQIRPAYVKRDEIGWIGTHRHDPNGNEPYVSSYLFLYALDVPAGAREVHLPANDRIRIMAATVASDGTRVIPAGPIYMADFADTYVVPPAPATAPKAIGGRRP